MSGTSIPGMITGISPIFIDEFNQISLGEQGASSQLAYFIDPVAGNDGATGLTALTPLRTHEELLKRIDGQIINVAMTVTLMNNFPSTNPVRVFFELGPLGSLRYVGTPTLLYTGSISAVTALDRATSTPWEIADASLPVSWAASGLLNTSTSGSRRIRLTSGTPGAFAWAVKEPVLKTARISPFMIEAIFPVPTPVVGNTFVVESLTQIEDLQVDVRTSSILTPSLRIPITFISIEIPPPPGGSDRRPPVRVLTPNGTQSPTVQFVGSEVGKLEWVGPGVSGHTATKFAGNNFFFGQGSVHTHFGCAILGNQIVEGDVIYDFDCLVQGFGLLTQGSGRIQAAQLGIFDRPLAGGVSDAILVRPGGLLESLTNLNSSQQLYGSGNTGFGIRFNSGGFGDYTPNKPVLTGTAGDVNLAGTALAYAAIPATNAAELAALRLRL